MLTAPLTRLMKAAIAGAAILGTTVGPGPDLSEAPVPPTAPVPSAAPVSPAVLHDDPGVLDMPLRAGRTMIYETAGGERFSLSFLAPVTAHWFDGTVRRLVPVADSRCGCRFLFRNLNGEIRVVGSIQGDRMEQWGEYIQVLPRELPPRTGSVQTPLGRFVGVVEIRTEQGTAWFAPGVGIVKTTDFVLVDVKE